MIQVREQYGNLYVRILDTHATFDYTLQKIRYIQGRTFNTVTGEWMFGKESIGDLLRQFGNQIIWNKPLSEILKGCIVDDVLVQKHLSWENDDDFKSWKLKPYPYQKVSAHFLADRKQAAVFDGVGLGKTISIVGASQILINRGLANKILIVTLNSIKRQWAKEIEKFSGEVAIAVTGTAAQRIKLIKGFAQRDDIKYLVVNYETLKGINNMNELKKIPFDVMALDESQKIKSGVTDEFLNIKPSGNASACYELAKNIPYRFLATATPVQSKAEEIWSLFNFVDPNILGSWNIFREEHCKYSQKFGITGSINLTEIFFKISPYFIRRTKEMPEIQQQLPKVQHSHIFLEMTDAQIKIQNHILDKLEDLKEQSRGISGTKVINGMLMNMDQQKEYLDGIQQGLQTFMIENCDTPALLSHPESSPMAHSIIKELGISEKDALKSPKIEKLKEFVKDVMADDKISKIVIFTQYEKMARILHEELGQGVLYTGKISEDEKERAKESFCTDPNTRIFISTSAGATGTNLQFGNYMVHFDLPFTSTDLEQRNGRIDRTGNPFANITMLYYLMSESYEEDMIEMIHKKSVLANTILTGQVEASSKKAPDFAKIAFDKLAKKRAKRENKKRVAVGS